MEYAGGDKIYASAIRVSEDLWRGMAKSSRIMSDDRLSMQVAAYVQQLALGCVAAVNGETGQ